MSNTTEPKKDLTQAVSNTQSASGGITKPLGASDEVLFCAKPGFPGNRPVIETGVLSKSFSLKK